MEVRATAQKQHGIGMAPNAFVKHGCLSPSRYERDAVPVIAHAAQPLHGLTPEWGIAPDSPMPSGGKTVVRKADMVGGSRPWAA
jgi:hypothetical protein